MRQFSLVSSTSTCTFVDFLIRWRAPLLSEQTHRKLDVRKQIAPIASGRTVSIQDGISLIGSAISSVFTAYLRRTNFHEGTCVWKRSVLVMPNYQMTMAWWR